MTDMDMPLPEPAHTQVETYSGIALNKVVETPLFTADQLRAYGEAVRAEERERWEAAMKQAWSMIDPFNPAGVPGSYARGQDSGIVAALTTVRANYVAAAAIRAAAPPQCTAPPSEPQ